jgi:hypothetical protein
MYLSRRVFLRAKCEIFSVFLSRGETTQGWYFPQWKTKSLRCRECRRVRQKGMLGDTHTNIDVMSSLISAKHTLFSVANKEMKSRVSMSDCLHTKERVRCDFRFFDFSCLKMKWEYLHTPLFMLCALMLKYTCSEWEIPLFRSNKFRLAFHLFVLLSLWGIRKTVPIYHLDNRTKIEQ